MTLRHLTAQDFKASGQIGFNFGYSVGGAIPDADFDALRDTGATHARVFIIPTRRDDNTGYDLPDVQLSKLALIVAGLAARGMWAIPVLAFGFDGTQALLWANPALRASALSIIVGLVSLYAGDPRIGAVDIFNEPIPPDPRVSVWRAFAQEAIDLVRKSDPTRVLVVESVPGGLPQVFNDVAPFADANIVYSLHCYQPYALTHQQGILSEYPDAHTYVDADHAELLSTLAPAAAWSLSNRLPVYVGEFSCNRHAPGDSATRYVRDCMGIFRSMGWSWAYHEFRAFPAWDPEAIGPDSSYTRSPTAPTITALKQETTMSSKITSNPIRLLISGTSWAINDVSLAAGGTLALAGLLPSGTTTGGTFAVVAGTLPSGVTLDPATGVLTAASNAAGEAVGLGFTYTAP